MRAEAPVVKVHLPLLGKVWVTTTDDAIRKMLKANDLFVRNPKPVTGKTLQQALPYLPKFMSPIIDNMISVDAPDHTRRRKLVDQAFARRNIAEMVPELEAIADGLLDQMDPERPVDILKTYAHQLPLIAICALLGVPVEERDMVAGWIAPISGPTNLWTLIRAMPGFKKLIAYFRAEFVTQRKTPRPGLISQLLDAETDGQKLTDDELLSMVVMLFIAGHETTVHLINMTILHMVTRPDARAVMTDTPEALPLLLEEVMRFDSPVMMTKPHFVARDVVFEGVRLRKGDKIIALVVSGNRDPARFEAPDEFRPSRRPNAHLGFGHGPHVCVGIQLARAEARVAIERLFAHYPDFRLSNPDKMPAYTKRLGIHGLKRLDIRLLRE